MKLLKWVGIAVAAVLVLFGAAIGGLKLKGPNSRPAPELEIEATDERLARGKYLVENVVACAHCHSEMQRDLWGVPPNPAKLGAGVCHTGPEVADFPGRLCVPNITSHKTAGLGAWTDGELLRAIREGIGRDGRALFPMMPYTEYRHMSDEDAHAVVAYLRTMPAIDHQVEPLTLDFPVSLFIQFAPEPVESVPSPNHEDSVAYGKYLTSVAGCAHCHTPMGDDHKPVPGKELAGGQEFSLGTRVVRSSNLTFHETGLGNRTKEEFIARFRVWAEDSARNAKVDPAKNTMMPWQNYAGMTDADLGAIYDFLASLPKVDNKVETFGAAPALAHEG